jgi:hypothetical protein
MAAGDTVRYFARNGAARVASLLLVAPITPFLLQTPDNPVDVPLDSIRAQLDFLHEDRPAFNPAAVAAFLGTEYQPAAEFLRRGLDHVARASLVGQAATFRAFSTTDFRYWSSFGRRTYLIHAEACEPMPPGDHFGDLMNAPKKYVVSRTLEKPRCRNTTIIREEVIESVRALKAGPGGNILTDGSSQLVHALRTHDVVDELRLLVYPCEDA